jgi:hypothetical protein
LDLTVSLRTAVACLLVLRPDYRPLPSEALANMR